MNQIEMKKRQIKMFSGILGMIVLLVLGNMLGNNGVTYIAVAVEVFLLFWTLTGSRLADTLGRILKGRSSKGQYKNATKLRKNALLLEGFLGLLGSVIMFFAAKSIGEGLFGQTYSIVMIRMLSLGVFIRTLSAVYLGYFQGEGTEMPTVITCFVRPVGIFLFSLIAVNLLKGYGSKVSDLLRQDNYTAMYAGMGVALAVLLTEILILVLLFVLYQGSGRKGKKNGAEGMRTTDTFAGQAVALYSTMFPSILHTVLLLLPVWLGITFLSRSQADAGIVTESYGVFVGKLFPILVILILPGWMMLLGTAHRAVSCYRKEEQRFAKGYFMGGFHMAVVYGGFGSVFMAVMAAPIANLFCKNAAELATNMFRYGSVVIFLMIMGFYFTELLASLGGKYYILGLAGVYDVIYVISLAVTLNGGKAGVMALIYSAVFAGIVYVLATAGLVLMQLQFRVDWMQGLAVPAGVAAAVGLILYFLSKVINPHLGHLVTLLVTLVSGNVFYWVFLMLMRNFRESELSYIPCGKLIRVVGQMLRIY